MKESWINITSKLPLLQLLQLIHTAFVFTVSSWDASWKLSYSPGNVCGSKSENQPKKITSRIIWTYQDIWRGCKTWWLGCLQTLSTSARTEHVQIVLRKTPTNKTKECHRCSSGTRMQYLKSRKSWNDSPTHEQISFYCFLGLLPSCHDSASLRKLWPLRTSYRALELLWGQHTSMQQKHGTNWRIQNDESWYFYIFPSS